MSDLETVDQPIPYFLRRHIKSDGRELRLYGRQPHTLPVTEDLSPADPPNPHLRWHPLRQEWVIYATHRQARTFMPPAEYCPLCPVKEGGFPGEIPFADFEVAVFPNRFPGMHADAHDPPGLDIPTAPSNGLCEVMVYTSDHEASFGALSADRQALVVQAWIDLYRDLMARQQVQFVMPFENRGEAVGVTLHHPHGQIYAFPFIPPVVERMVTGFRKTPELRFDLLRQAEAGLAVVGDDRMQALVPPFARFPFEVWVLPKTFHPGPGSFDAEEIRSFAGTIGRVTATYDALFGQPMPLIMLLYAAPKGAEDVFPFHVQFLPFLRDANKFKFLAGCEQGAGTFLVDVAPEEMARRLRDAAETL